MNSEDPFINGNPFGYHIEHQPDPPHDADAHDSRAPGTFDTSGAFNGQDNRHFNDFSELSFDQFIDNVDPFNPDQAADSSGSAVRDSQLPFGLTPDEPPPIILGGGPDQKIQQNFNFLGFPEGNQQGAVHHPDGVHVLPTTTSNEVYNAATILNNSRSPQGRTQSVPMFQWNDAFSQASLFPASSSPHIPQHHASFSSIPMLHEQFSFDSLNRATDQTTSGPALGALYYPGVPVQQNPVRHRFYRFGSDQSFSTHGFTNPELIQEHAATQSRVMRDLSSLRPAFSGTNTEPNTEPSSPVMERREKPSKPLKIDANANEDLEVGGSIDSPRGCNKRKRSQRTDSMNRGTDPSPTKQRKISNSSDAQKDAKGTYRGHSVLTEEEKRYNHILSEQRRRNLIKDKFDKIYKLVPNIEDGGGSRSAVLQETGNFIEQLQRENSNLQALMNSWSAQQSNGGFTNGSEVDDEG